MKVAIYHLLIYLLINSLLNLYIGKNYSRSSLWLLSLLLTLTVSALMSYSVDWKAQLRPNNLFPTASSSNESKTESTSTEPKKASEEELSYFQFVVFTPLACIYLVLRLAWLYFRMCIYYFVDGLFSFVSSIAGYLTSIKWHNHLMWMQTTAYEILGKLKQLCAPYLDEIKEYFPYAYDCFARFLRSSLLLASKLTAWSKKYFWVQLLQPIVEELFKGLKSFWSEIQPQLLRLKTLLLDYISFVTSDILEEIKHIFSWTYTWLVNIFSSLDYASFQRLCHSAYTSVANYINLLISLHEVDFQLLVDQAKKSITHYLTTEMVEFGLMLPHMFSLLLLWSGEVISMWLKEIPNLLLNILVWLLEDVIPPGSTLLIRANKRAWESSRAAYKFIKYVTFNIVEVFNAFIVLPLQTLVSFIYEHFVRAIPFFNAFMEFLSYIASFANVLFTKLSFVVTYILTYLLTDPMSYLCHNWIPRLAARLEAYQEKLDLMIESETGNGNTSGKNLAMAMAPYAKFVATELRSALISFTQSLEYWIAEQVPETPLKPASQQLKSD
ncbi:hypothetical protein DSO57_1027357 [Entomophthora muscae]|uniref:Uncharacterized protein n=1 Tax=Entomophthora muscae TaxID=34485 RepID=A0ACC2TCQ2_9FUNG|nr:hypothetical protein DSO57_1027357 [Entomophthora muscae]